MCARACACVRIYFIPVEDSIIYTTCPVLLCVIKIVPIIYQIRSSLGGSKIKVEEFEEHKQWNPITQQQKIEVQDIWHFSPYIHFITTNRVSTGYNSSFATVTSVSLAELELSLPPPPFWFKWRGVKGKPASEYAPFFPIFCGNTWLYFLKPECFWGFSVLEHTHTNLEN